jgi:uncharacterized protein involved in outer membrane biogenesis
MKNRCVRILLAIIVVVVVAILLLPFVVNANSFRPTIEAQLRNSLE